MTRVEVAAGRAGPTEMPGNGARRAKADGIFDEADAGFMAQLTSLTVEEEAGGSTPHSKDAMKAVLARWWQQRSAGAQASLPAEADGEASDAPTADVAALLTGQVDAQVGVDVVPTAGPRSSEDKPARAKEDGRWHAQPHAQPSDAGPPTGALPSILAAAPTVHANAEPGQVPARPLPAAAPSASVWGGKDGDSLPAAAKVVPAQAIPRTVDVDISIQRAETHFAPVQQAASVPDAVKPVSVEKPVAQKRADDGDSWQSDPPAEGEPRPRLDPALPRGAANQRPVAKVAGERADPGAAPGNGNGEDVTPAVPLSTRGLPHPIQPAASPVRQIADQIAANLSSRETSQPQTAPAEAARPAATPPVKVLTIQLQPAELGTVTVRMTLKADAMDVHVEVNRRATARLIDADRDALTNLLRGAGYHVEALTVRAVEQPSAVSTPGPMSASPDSGGTQVQAGGSQSDGRAPGGRPQQNQHAAQERGSNDSEQAGRDRRGAGVYV